MTVQTNAEVEISLQTSEGVPLAATLYRPSGPVIAAVLDVHGGAWTSGDRTMNASIARHLAANGIAVLSLDFRMPPHTQYPELLTEISAGVRWLKTHASEVGTDAAHVGILGTSSGGHLALLTALRPNDSRYSGPSAAGEPETAVHFAVLCWPVSDPAARFRMATEKNNAKLMAAHNAFWPDEAAMTEGSPVDIVTRGDAQWLPPLIIIQGTNDENLTPDMQDRFVAAYRAKGGSVEMHVYEGQPHGFITPNPTSDASLDALEKITAFIKKAVS